MYGVDVPGFASLIVSIMFFAGVQLLSLGVLGEYIGRIFAEVKRRPLYLVAERIGGERVREMSRRRAHRSAASEPRMYEASSRWAAGPRFTRKGFFRDVLLGAVLGAGRVADTFVIAFRLPNHFRAIFGEGAFNAAYVPAYSRALETGARRGQHFSGQMLTLLLISQLVFLAFALVFTRIGPCSRAGLRERSRKIRACGHADADHLSLSALRHAGDIALGRHSTPRTFCRRGVCAGPAQSHDDRLCRARVPVSRCRRCRQLLV